MNVSGTMSMIMRRRVAEARAQAMQEVVDRSISSLSMGVSVRVTRAVAQKILLGSPWTWNGRIFSVTAKSVGAGVYELSIEGEQPK